jgi:hypothetical protein
MNPLLYILISAPLTHVFIFGSSIASRILPCTAFEDRNLMMETVPNRGPRLQAVGIALVSTALLSTLLRVYTRMFIVKRFGLDDWCMIAALVSIR